MLRKAVLVTFLLSAVAVVAGVAVQPSMYVYEATKERGLYTEKSYERTWELLPLKDWGVTPYEMQSNNAAGKKMVHVARFGVICLTETAIRKEQIRIQPYTCPPQPVQIPVKIVYK